MGKRTNRLLDSFNSGSSLSGRSTSPTNLVRYSSKGSASILARSAATTAASSASEDCFLLAGSDVPRAAAAASLDAMLADDVLVSGDERPMVDSELANGLEGVSNSTDMVGGVVGKRLRVKKKQAWVVVFRLQVFGGETI